MKSSGFALRFPQTCADPVFYSDNQNGDWAYTDSPADARIFTSPQEAKANAIALDLKGYEVVAIDRTVIVSVKSLPKEGERVQLKGGAFEYRYVNGEWQHKQHTEWSRANQETVDLWWRDGLLTPSTFTPAPAEEAVR